jgi:hypothetical protein
MLLYLNVISIQKVHSYTCLWCLNIYFEPDISVTVNYPLQIELQI